MPNYRKWRFWFKNRNCSKIAEILHNYVVLSWKMSCRHFPLAFRFVFEKPNVNSLLHYQPVGNHQISAQWSGILPNPCFSQQWELLQVCPPKNTHNKIHIKQRTYSSLSTGKGSCTGCPMNRARQAYQPFHLSSCLRCRRLCWVYGVRGHPEVCVGGWLLVAASSHNECPHCKEHNDFIPESQSSASKLKVAIMEAHMSSKFSCTETGAVPSLWINST